LRFGRSLAAANRAAICGGGPFVGDGALGTRWWKQLMNRRNQHPDLALEHFSLSLNDVQKAALRR